MLIYSVYRPLDPPDLVSVCVFVCVNLLCWLHLEVWLMMEEIPFANYRWFYFFFPEFLLSSPSHSLSLYFSACLSLSVSLSHFVSTRWKITIIL